MELRSGRILSAQPQLPNRRRTRNPNIPIAEDEVHTQAEIMPQPIPDGHPPPPNEDEVYTNAVTMPQPIPNGPPPPKRRRIANDPQNPTPEDDVYTEAAIMPQPIRFFPIKIEPQDESDNNTSESDDDYGQEDVVGNRFSFALALMAIELI